MILSTSTDLCKVPAAILSLAILLPYTSGVMTGPETILIPAWLGSQDPVSRVLEELIVRSIRDEIV